MKILSAALFALLLMLACAAQTTESIKLMTFNIWLGGGSGARWERTVTTMRESGADVIGIQETSNDENVAKIAAALKWNYVVRGNTAIFTRYNISAVGSGINNSGAKITTPSGASFYIFNAHLAYKPYQPYQIYNITYGTAPFIKTESLAIKWADETRGHQVVSLITDVNSVKAAGLPVFILGDFNEPSCLDWTKATTAAGLTKIPVAWPSTKKLLDVGFMDAFREIHPDSVAKPGITWTTGTSLPERHDRIDFILYNKNGNKVSVRSANVVGEPGNVQTDIPVTDFPSDHRAVLVEFTLRP